MPHRRNPVRKFSLLAALALIVALGVALTPARAQNKPPGKVVELFDLPVTSNADILTSTFTAQRASVAYRATIAVSGTNSVVNVEIRDADGTPATVYNLDLNSSTALTAGALYTFTFSGSDRFTYNVNCETSTTLAYLLIEEIKDGEL
jgi:hypothetical protein